VKEGDIARADQLVGRLVGPAGPELNCEECFDALDRYVDLELTGTTATADALVPGMRAHLEGCSACRADHESLLALLRSDQDSEA
jgi:predicted anti-sigma-YlaC factor YlaD